MINANKTFDSLLVLQYQSGNKKAAGILVKRWHGRLCAQANWYVRNKEISKDIVQDSWDIILMKVYHLKDTNSFGSWALSIVTRRSIDWLRKNKKEQDVLNSIIRNSDPVVMPEEVENEESNKKMLLRRAIETLPVDQQMVLRLFYVEEYRVKEIAKILVISEGTVKSRLFTAREKLKLILKT
ncbi:RNA polymerase sigma factor [Aquimarina sp. Aq107]|uniref:RNA polymerase sigma factor n=1 Tax=Aquimarina sp. Aq107 TaxID=1191912 RepID=UPI001F34863E|nr:sigma-70 family RNA polymerase sigma factor [Aquimarina sp. Aq107]